MLLLALRLRMIAPTVVPPIMDAGAGDTTIDGTITGITMMIAIIMDAPVLMVRHQDGDTATERRSVSDYTSRKAGE